MRERWAGVGFVVLEVVLLAAIPALAWVGFRAVLDTTEGRVVDPVLDPEEPGYEAFVDATPVQLVLGVDVEGDLSWATLLVLSGVGEAGGAVEFVPVGTVAEVGDVGQSTLRDAWDGGEHQAQVVQAVADLLGAGIDDVVVLEPSRVTGLVRPAGPLAVVNGDELAGFGTGELELDGDDVAAYLEARDPNESDLARLARHDAVWRSWLAAVGASSDPDVVPGETGSGIGRFVRGLASGPVTFDVLPGTPFVPPDAQGADGEALSVAEAEIYAPDVEAAQSRIEDLVPFPVAARPGARARVRVLDAVGADGLALRVARDVVRAGGQVVVVGNADEFGAATSRVVYFIEGLGDIAAEIAEGVGVDTPERDPGPNPNDLVDITVVVGSDLATAYGLTPRG